MAVALNSYAAKAYSEHPISLWSMDDDSYYLSLIEDSDRLFSNWTASTSLSGISVSTYDNNPLYLPNIARPFDSGTYSTIVSGSSSASYTLRLTSPIIFNATDLDLTKKSFCVNFFIYNNPVFISSFKTGYKYLDSSLVSHTIMSASVPAPSGRSWLNFNKTYDTPTDLFGSIQLIFEITFKANSDSQSRTLTMNGLSVGQWSESVCYKSLGVYSENLPSSLDMPGYEGIAADQYGVLSKNGYYIIENNSILAQNDGPPLIFGTDNCTKITPSLRQQPSFVFPGTGMFNEVGRNNNYTLECWLQIKPSTNIARRIIGPLGNDYGIYVREGFISLVLGDTVQSHSISEWYRPMLMHLTIKDDVATVLINGEQVISISFDKENIELPNEQDWWGIYSYLDIDLFKIDCISIYPYSISNSAAKRRFVWGQGTTSLQFIDDSFSGTPTTIDFSTAKYTSNVIYPDIAQWNSGYFDNMVATNNSISIPEYSLPTIYLGGRDIQEWYEANQYINKLEYPDINHPKFVSLKPNTKSNEVYSYITSQDYWENESWLNFTSTHFMTNQIASTLGILPSFEYDSFQGSGNNWDDASYISFPSINVLTSPVVSLYGIFEIQANISESRPLMHFINTINNKTFSIDIIGTTVVYSFNNSIIHTESIEVDEHFVVGLNFDLIGQAFGYEVKNFFSSPSSVQLVVGGDKINTFEGKIYRVGFSNANNFEETKDSYQENGIVLPSNDELFINEFASYTLIVTDDYDRFSLDISVSSNWEEYYPLSQFAGYVQDELGNSYYDVDFMQINIGYPTIALKIAWRYSELQDLGLQYYQLNESYTNYENLNNNNTSNESLDTSNSSLKMYMTFQDVSQENILPLNSFQYTKTIPSDMVIKPDSENTIAQPYKAYETKFEFKDNVIVYPPKSKDFNNIQVVFHFVVNQKGIIKSPLRISNFEITSRALSENSFNPIGTKFGTPISSYVKTYSASVETYDGKEENPILIYKRATPYLYDTENSGIKLLYKNTTQKEYVSSIPVNSSKASNYNVGAMQLWMMYDDLSFSSSAQSIFEISYLEDTIQFVIDPSDNGDRGKIYPRFKNNYSKSTSFINFYQNGVYVKNPTINAKQWNCIGILFNESLDFSNYKGSINLFGGIYYNNISYYLTEGLAITKTVNARDWQNVWENTSPPPAYFSWSYWNDDNIWSDNTWKNVYLLSLSNQYSISPENIYQSYVGTNRDVIDDDSGFSILNSSFSTYSTISWSQQTEKPS